VNTDVDALIQIARLAAIILGIVIVVGGAIAIVGAIKAPELAAKVLLAIIHAGSAIRMATVLVIVAAIVGLRVLDKISAEAAIGALSGIAGYILGGARNPFHPTQEADTPQSN
jgi:hypothetical protein